jgi:hypothetical protein
VGHLDPAGNCDPDGLAVAGCWPSRTTFGSGAGCRWGIPERSSPGLVLWTGLLASHDVGLAGSALLFGVYMVPFMLDDPMVFGAAVATMRAARLQERHGRLLKLVAGTVMLALAGTVVVAPDVMEDVVGASLVFASAISVAVVARPATSRHAAQRDRHGAATT